MSVHLRVQLGQKSMRRTKASRMHAAPMPRVYVSSFACCWDKIR